MYMAPTLLTKSDASQHGLASRIIQCWQQTCSKATKRTAACHLQCTATHAAITNASPRPHLLLLLHGQTAAAAAAASGKCAWPHKRATMKTH
jgi:hypothetical protein